MLKSPARSWSCLLLCLGALALTAGEEADAALARLKARVPGVRVTRTAEQFSVAGLNHRLTRPDARDGARKPADAHANLRDFLDDYRALIGGGRDLIERSRMTRDGTSAHSGLRTTVWQREVSGIAVFGAVMVANQAGDGAVIAFSHAGARGELKVPVVIAPFIDAGAALITAIMAAGGESGPAAVSTAPLPGDATRRQRLTADGLRDEAYTWLSWLPVNGALVLCWDICHTGAHDQLMRRTLVDAVTGAVRLDRVLTVITRMGDQGPGAKPAPIKAVGPARLQARRAPAGLVAGDGAAAPSALGPAAGTSSLAATMALRCFAWPKESPRPLLPGRATASEGGLEPPEVPRDLITLDSIDATASPDGWVSGTETKGNNVDAYLDINNDNSPDSGRPTGSGSPLTFDFPLDLALAPTGADYRKAAVVNLFYWCNFAHDRLYQLGFTESAGNFQVNNFGNGGLGGDPVRAEAQDGSGVNNANFSTPPDGVPARMQMFNFTAPTPDRDGDFDASIILHEYAHGMSTRLVGGGDGSLVTSQGGGMGEGWSDFIAIALLSQAGDDVNGNYPVGSYVVQNYFRGIRSVPYTSDPVRNPLTLAALNSRSEVHDVGEVWCTILWEMRCALVNKHGFAGNELALRLVTDGLKLTPSFPTFIQARDAILQADVVGSGGANLRALWGAFAKRGIGPNATVPGDGSTLGTQADTTVPSDLLVSVPGGRIDLDGPPGGPFPPGPPALTIANLSDTSLTWTATSDVPWVTLGSSGTVLAPAGSFVLTLATNAATAALPLGLHQGSIAVTNASGGAGSTAIPITVAVGADYTITTPAIAFIDPVGHATGAFGDDAVSTGQTIPFAFAFYGRPVSQVFIGSNGLIGFTAAGLTNFANVDLPSSALPNGIICPLWSDLFPPQTGAKISIGTNGAAPNRRLVVTWTKVPHFSSKTNGFTFQVLLHETSNDITMQYVEVRPTLTGVGAGRAATVGVENSTGTRATRFSFNGSRLLTNNSAIRFSNAPTTTAPTITAIPAQIINEDTSTAALAFSINDAETPATALTVTATSTNSVLVPVANLLIGGAAANRVLTVIPAANRSGSSTITVTVSDGTLSATSSFLLTVNAVNDTPTIAPPTAQVTAEDTAKTVSFVVGDVDGDTLTTSATVSNASVPGLIAGAAVVGSTVVITPAANLTGTATITLTVNDGQGGTANTAFDLTVTAVNDLPTMASIAAQVTQEDTVATIPFVVGDVDGDPLTTTSAVSNESVPGLVASAAVVGSTVVITPAANLTGTATITLTVNDGQGGTANTAFDLTVTAVNDAPTIALIAAQTTAEDTVATIPFVVADLDGDALTTSVSVINESTPGLIASAAVVGSTVVITPATDKSGTATITLTVNDGQGGTANTAFVLTVTAVNDAPTIALIAAQTTAEDTVATIPFVVADLDGDALNTSASVTNESVPGLIASAAVVGSIVVITPAADKSGAATITLTVNDGRGGTANTAFVLTVNAVNDAPTITDIANRTISEDGNTGAIPFTIGDAESAATALTLTVASGNTVLVPISRIVLGGSGANRTVTITPAANQFGSALITITVADGTTSAFDRLTLTVNPVNDRPTISDTVDQTVLPGGSTAALAFTVGDIDTALALLTVSASSSNAALVPSANIVLGGTGTARTVAVSGTPGVTGTATITVTVSDGLLSASDTFVLTAQAARAPDVVIDPVPGVTFAYYHHSNLTTVTTLDTLVPVATGARAVGVFQLQPRTQNDRFGFVFTGHLSVPVEGIYRLFTTSDDGSRLLIGNTLVVNNDGAHGSIERSGTIALQAGLHAITVSFFENAGGETLSVRWSGPGIAKQLIPDANLFRSGAPAVPVNVSQRIPTWTAGTDHIGGGSPTDDAVVALGRQASTRRDHEATGHHP